MENSQDTMNKWDSQPTELLSLQVRTLMCLLQYSQVGSVLECEFVLETSLCISSLENQIGARCHISIPVSKCVGTYKPLTVRGYRVLVLQLALCIVERTIHQ